MRIIIRLLFIFILVILGCSKNDENINVKRGYFAYKTSHAHSDK